MLGEVSGEVWGGLPGDVRGEVWVPTPLPTPLPTLLQVPPHLISELKLRLLASTSTTKGEEARSTTLRAKTISRWILAAQKVMAAYAPLLTTYYLLSITDNALRTTHYSLRSTCHWLHTTHH